MTHSCESSRARARLAFRGHANSYLHHVDNNNNNTIWGGSVLTGEELPPHSGELKHALTQAGGPTQSQLSRPFVVRTPHLHGAPTTEETGKL